MSTFFFFFKAWVFGQMLNFKQKQTNKQNKNTCIMHSILKLKKFVYLQTWLITIYCNFDMQMSNVVFANKIFWHINNWSTTSKVGKWIIGLFKIVVAEWIRNYLYPGSDFHESLGGCFSKSRGHLPFQCIWSMFSIFSGVRVVHLLLLLSMYYFGYFMFFLCVSVFHVWSLSLD